MSVGETDDDIRARVSFELALKQLKGNHSSIARITFEGVEFGRQPDWAVQLAAALGENTTCKELDLSRTGFTDAGVQQLATALVIGSRCPQLRQLNLRGNSLTAMGETMLQGLQKLRPSLEISIGEEPLAEGFVHEKQLVEGRSAWPAETLKVPDTQYDYYCPEAVAGEGEKIVLTRGFQGPNGHSARQTSFHTHARPRMRARRVHLRRPPRHDRVQMRPGHLRALPPDGQHRAA